MASEYIYHHNGIRCDDGTVVALKFIESMKFQTEEADAIVDKLKGDLPLFFRTVSGKEYLVSINQLMSDLGIVNYPKEEVRMAIYTTWSAIIRG